MYFAQVQASDCDAGPNAAIEYSLVSDMRTPRRTVRIDARTGELYLQRDLDFEQTSDQSFVLFIQARDSPTVGPRLSATATLTVNVRLRPTARHMLVSCCYVQFS